MSHTIVTAGRKYADIDAVACAIAYAELLRLEGIDAIASLPGKWNNTVLPEQKELFANTQKTVECTNDTKLVFVDLSEEKHFAYFDAEQVDYSMISEIYDHHYGHEEYWKNILGERSHIERVGACATQITEEWTSRASLSEMSRDSAELLLCAIVQNTLNFTSSETSDRDHVAYNQLLTELQLDESWKEEYLNNLSLSIENNIIESLEADTKIFSDFYNGKDLYFSQVEIPRLITDVVGNAELEKFLRTNTDSICLINVVDIEKQTSYIFSNDAEFLVFVKNSLSEFDPQIVNNVVTVQALQRKKILQKIQ